MKVLITGFQPFGKETMNPSFEAVRLLPDEIMGAQIVKAEIPVVFHKGGEKVQELVRSEKPDIVILVGQAGGRTAMNPERVAINCEDCPTGGPDNEGNVPQGEKIYEDGPDAYFSKLPIKAMVKKMMDNGVPAYPRRLHPCSVRDHSEPSELRFDDHRGDQQRPEALHRGCNRKRKRHCFCKRLHPLTSVFSLTVRFCSL